MAVKIASIVVVNVRLPKEIVKWLDTLVARRLYHSRSEAIRDFMREYLEEAK